MLLRLASAGQNGMRALQTLAYDHDRG